MAPVVIQSIISVDKSPGRGGVLTGVDRAQRDRRFSMGLVLAIALTNFVGFGRTYYLRFVFGEPTGIFGQYLSPLNHFTTCSLRPSSSFWSCRRGSSQSAGRRSIGFLAWSAAAAASPH